MDLNEIIIALKGFMEAGGDVLWFIVFLTLAMWTLILERIWYFHGGLKRDLSNALEAWESRAERKSWYAHQVRDKLISEVSLKIRQFLPMIQTMVTLCPLFGLLGTVTGMIDVFTVLAVTGGGDAKSMAGGVSKATIPTMAGMVAALSGILANTYIKRVADREQQLLADHLTTDH